MLPRILSVTAGIIAGLTILVLGLAVIAILVTYPRLPSLDVLTDYRPKIPLRVYTQDKVLIGEFGEERRSFTKIGDVPQLMKQAVLSAEDERFYQHGGIDYIGVMRAAVGNIVSGRTHSGASTITMQVAKNFFLSSEKTFTRKFNEALLAFKIEHTLSKDQILELYFNQIYLGQRA
jgi:penicillin-binding protein 1A